MAGIDPVRQRESELAESLMGMMGERDRGEGGGGRWEGTTQELAEVLHYPDAAWLGSYLHRIMPRLEDRGLCYRKSKVRVLGSVNTRWELWLTDPDMF